MKNEIYWICLIISLVYWIANRQYKGTRRDITLNLIILINIPVGYVILALIFEVNKFKNHQMRE